MEDNDIFLKKIYNKYMFSSVLAVLGSFLGQIANNIMVGNYLGGQYLSVTGIVVPVYYIFATIGALLGIGGATLAANEIGRQNYQKSCQVFTLTYLSMFCIGAVLTALLLFRLDWLIRFLGVTDQLYEPVYQYAVVMILGGLFTMGIYPAFHFLRLDGKTKSAAFIFVLMALVNIFFDFLFLFGFSMGILGISLATSFGATAATVTGFVLLLKKSNNFRLVKPKHLFRLFWEIGKIGSPGALENVSILFRSLAFNHIILGGFGALALSAYSVTNSINSLALAIISGASGAIIPFIGVFSTEKDIGSIKQLLRIAIRESMLLILIFVLFCLLFPELLSLLFGMKSPEETAWSVPAIRIFCLSFPLAMINNILISFHIANERTKIANAATLARSLIFVVLLAFLLSGVYGIQGVWHSFWLTEVLTLFLLGIMHICCAVGKPNVSFITLIDESVEREGKYISFSVKNEQEAIAESAEKITVFCEKNNLDPQKTFAISLSLEEMLTSISSHSLGEDPLLQMNVRVLIQKDIVILRIRNGGRFFNPIAYFQSKDNPNAESDLERMDQLEDSLGIGMVLSIAKKVDFQRTFGINNLTILI